MIRAGIVGFLVALHACCQSGRHPSCGAGILREHSLQAVCTAWCGVVGKSRLGHGLRSTPWDRLGTDFEPPDWDDRLVGWSLSQRWFRHFFITHGLSRAGMGATPHRRVRALNGCRNLAGPVCAKRAVRSRLLHRCAGVSDTDKTGRVRVGQGGQGPGNGRIGDRARRGDRAAKTRGPHVQSTFVINPDRMGSLS